MSKEELRVVIRSAAARERFKGQRVRCVNRKRRLDAAAFYVRRFGQDEFIAGYCQRELPALKIMWLPRGYAWFKVRSGAASAPRT
jgi:hypothetical protein